MTSEPISDPIADHVITPENSAFLLIDYQPTEVGMVRSMDRDLLVKNAVSAVRTVMLYDVAVIHWRTSSSSMRFTRPGAGSSFSARYGLESV